MPQAGAGARGCQLAMLGSLAHERAVAPALGRLLDSLVGYGASLPDDFDDSSLIRVAHREYQKKIRYRPTILRAPSHKLRLVRCTDEGAAGQRLRDDGALSRTDTRPQPRVFLVLCALQARLAQHAGGGWPEQACRSATYLSRAPYEPSVGVQLLAALRASLDRRQAPALPKPFVSVEPTGPSVYRTVDREHLTLILPRMPRIFGQNGSYQRPCRGILVPRLQPAFTIARRSDFR